MSILYEVCCNETQGRHLRARYDLSRHDLIFCERPMVVQQSLGLNTLQAWVCHACHGFVGNPTLAMQHRFSSAASTSSLPSCEEVTPCRQKCGHVYCNTDCENDAWYMHHRLLCTGHIADHEEHPLLQFKRLAVESNEILLLIAQWWIMEHQESHSKRNNQNMSEVPSDESKWRNFCMNPWWEVATLELRNLPGSFAEIVALDNSLRQLCQDAAEAFNLVLRSSNEAHDIPPITALDIAKRVGACEQNAIGIRQRHPLCRAVFDREFREMHHTQIIQCLAEAGFIGADGHENDANGEEEEDDDDDDDDDCCAPLVPGTATTDWNYSVDEIAEFLSELYIQEDGMVIDSASQTHEMGDSPVSALQGDDFDHIFPPLDGTAMYSLACKMNHSCDPNVLLVYHSNPSWQRPLTLFALAIKDIEEGEELTISYIDHSSKSLQERQQALINYGFVCQCSLCLKEQEGDPKEQELSNQNRKEENDDLFGSDSANEDKNDHDNYSDDEGNDVNQNSQVETEKKDAEEKLQACLERLDSIRNHVLYGAVPLPVFAKASSFVTLWIHVQRANSSLPMEYMNLVQQCVQGIEQRDFALLELLGIDSESILFSVLQSENAWPNDAYRSAYWCAVIIAALGRAHRWCFLDALQYLDRGIVFGLPVRTDNRLSGLMSYVEHHAYTISELPVPTMLCDVDILPDYKDPSMQQHVEAYALSGPLQYRLPDEMHEPPFHRTFSSKYVHNSRPVILRGFAREWPALLEWRNMGGIFGQMHGHRQIPIERGSMLPITNVDGSMMQEEIMSLRTLVRTIYANNQQNGRLWSLQDAQTHTSSIVYLAQHPLLEQIPLLKQWIDASPPLCGDQGPTHTNVWIGSAGTRTPLHYDSYDNWLVQVVGVKYVRLYRTEESSKLYVVSKSSGGSHGGNGGVVAQGNMSALNCEDEDWQQHPLAKDASYSEIVLYPGDGLYIPARMWHYVRSLTPSISINFWF